MLSVYFGLAGVGWTVGGFMQSGAALLLHLLQVFVSGSSSAGVYTCVRAKGVGVLPTWHLLFWLMNAVGGSACGYVAVLWEGCTTLLFCVHRSAKGGERCVRYLGAGVGH